MTNLNTYSKKFSLLIFIALVMTIHFSHYGLVTNLEKADSLHPVALVPSYDAVRLVSLGFDKLLADCYWLSFVCYYGDSESRLKDKYVLADRYLELITSLDPQFIQPYWFAAFTIGSEQKNPKRAELILERGIEANKDNWYLPFIAGFNQYMFAKDEVAAARYYRMASKYPDAPPWLSRQADILEAKIPSLIKEVNAWNDVYNSVEEEGLKQRAKEKLISLWLIVYKRSPSEAIRAKAAKSLHNLGISFRFRQ